MQIIHENEYEETMKNIVTPYLLACRRELYVPGADYPFRNESKRITGKIHMLQYLSDIDMPKRCGSHQPRIHRISSKI